jgi:hypothetical protein
MIDASSIGYHLFLAGLFSGATSGHQLFAARQHPARHLSGATSERRQETEKRSGSWKND